jgi:hypothetical protein
VCKLFWRRKPLDGGFVHLNVAEMWRRRRRRAEQEGAVFCGLPDGAQENYRAELLLLTPLIWRATWNSCPVPTPDFLN